MMLVKPTNEQKENSANELHQNGNQANNNNSKHEEQRAASGVNRLIERLISNASKISHPHELYKQMSISSDDLHHVVWISTLVNHSQLFDKTAYLKSSQKKQSKMLHIYYTVFERLLFELNLFHIFYAYAIEVDNHSPWDNLNPSSLFILCGNLQKLHEQAQPTEAQIQYFFDRISVYEPFIKYKCVNSDRWKVNYFEDANADINNDYHFVSRILHDQLFDVEDAEQQQQMNHHLNHNHNHNNNNHPPVQPDNDSKEKEKEKEMAHAINNESPDNYVRFQIYLRNKHNGQQILVKSDTVQDTFNVATNEELSRNMITPSVYLKSGHMLGARKWIPESDLYGTVMIKCRNTILIEKNSYISANGAGYTSHYGKGHGLYYKQPHINNQGSKYFSGGGYGSNGKDAHPSMAIGGRVYGEKTLKKVLHFGSPSGGRERGGGIIELIANTIINYGRIAADGDSGNQFGGGSGGSIKIVCKKLINHGKITAAGGKGGIFEREYPNHVSALRVGGSGGYGRIAIYCEQFINVGTISPSPYVNDQNFKYDENIGFTPLALGKQNVFYV